MIETPRLILRPMQWEDVDPLLGVFADPNVMAAFASPPFERPDMERWVRRNLDHQDHYGYGLFSVILRDSGLLIGDCGLERMDNADTPLAELGYDVRSDHWNRGYATEAATAVRDHAFTTLVLPRLISLIRHGNHPSRRVAEKIGMTLAEEIERDGKRYWLYSLSGGQAPPRLN